VNNRVLNLFENACGSEKTFKTHKHSLDKFFEWCHKDDESFLLLGKKDLEDLLQDYVLYLKKKIKAGDLSPNSVSTMFAGIFKFLKYARKKFDKELILPLYPDSVKSGGENAITTDQLKILLETTRNKRDRAMVHFFASTGARPEAVCDLRLKDVSEWRDGFLKVVLYVGDNHEMITFLNPEASDVFNDYQEWRRNTKNENLTDESFAFRTAPYNSKHIQPQKMTTLTLSGNMQRLWKNSGIQRKKSGRRYDLAATTSIRKRFDTMLEFNPKVSVGATEYLMDHEGYLSGKHYRRPTEEQVFEACKAVSVELMINDECRLQQEIEKTKDEETKHSQEIELLKSKLRNVEIMLLELKSRKESGT